ncbi:MAG: DUF4011 domain-containing protein [Fimbriimonadaceae bacterium]
MPGDHDRGVWEQVRLLREKLLDLTLRNPMLNFRPSRTNGILFEGELSEHVWRRLVEDEKGLRFQGKPDPRRLPDALPTLDDGLYDYGDPVSLAFLRERAEEELQASLIDPTRPLDQLDDVLQAADTQSLLERKLYSIRRLARTSEEELGINTLFLAMGALDWTDVDGRSCRAPLIFIPVDLEIDRAGRYSLKYDGGDVGGNPPLAAKLWELGVQLPDFAERESWNGFFDEVRAIVSSRGWTVEDDFLYLGFFNFERFVMYEDLGGSNWQDRPKPWQHELAVALLGGGFPPAESKLTDASDLDRVRPAESSYEVFDADACQLLVLERVKEGHSILVEGPPGTGKSQTIANLIAEAVANGKTVLFVAAKRAAVDVVYRRLAEKGLAAMCLDLHAKTASRKGFFEELDRTLRTRVQMDGQSPLVERLEDTRRRLNELSAAVNDPVPPFGISPYTAMGRLSGLPPVDEEDLKAPIRFEDLAGFEEHRIQALLPLVEDLQAALPSDGPACQEPFYRCGLDSITPTLRLQIRQAVEGACVALADAWGQARRAAAILHVPEPAKPSEVAVLAACAQLADEAPPHEGVDLTPEAWRTAEPAIRETIAMLREHHGIARSLGSFFERDPLEEDWSPWATPLILRRDAFFRWFYKDYRQAVRNYRERLSGLQRPSADEMAGRAKAVLRGQELRRSLRSKTESLAPLFGVQWKGCQTDPDTLELLLRWALELRSEVEGGKLPQGLLAFLSGGDLKKGIEAARLAQRSVEAARLAFEEACRLLRFSALAWASAPWAKLEAKLHTWREHLDGLDAEIRRNKARQAVREAGLKILRAADEWPLAGRRLTNAFLRTYYEGVLDEAWKRRPPLRSFDRTAHEKTIEEFRRLDDQKLEYNALVVRTRHSKGVPRHAVAGSGLAKIRGEMQKRSRHMPIRKAMAVAGPDVQRIKPVFLMSPLTVAIHLPPEMPQFDLVVFDEASQIRPEEALCSIVRGRQLVVVGDTRQMPPTSFFDRVWADQEADDEDEDVQAGLQARGLESILDLMSARASDPVRRPDLRWHYRSVHPSLIEPSNRHVYGGRLVVFPSPSRDCDGHRVGIVFHRVAGQYHPGARQRVNPKEAEAVLHAVREHLVRSPELSLLVVAMNVQQSNLIDRGLQGLRLQEPDLFRAYDERHPNEPLSVKNLENVQGDERDVVMISVTYGPDETGRVAQRFGPILQEGGERRLNVLFSRARVRCEVFSSMSASDVQVGPDSDRKGLAFFREYLAYAETGRFTIDPPVEGTTDSPLEEELVRFLRANGFEADLHVGEGSCRVDVAVRDPDRPSRYALGIQCDGPAYHSARTARDRDKLRQRVLESRGWRLHRVWSHEWWTRRAEEERRLLEALRADLDEARPAPSPAADPAPVAAEVADPPTELPEVEEVPVEETPAAWLPPYWVAQGVEADPVPAIVAQEGPICHELLQVRLRDWLGYRRSGAYVQRDIDAIVREALMRGVVVQIDDAYLLPDADPRSVARDWSACDPVLKQAKHVTRVELRSALYQLLRSAGSVSADAAAREVWRLLGFQRVGREAIHKAQTVIDQALGEGWARVSADGALRPAEP